MATPNQPPKPIDVNSLPTADQLAAFGLTNVYQGPVRPENPDRQNYGGIKETLAGLGTGFKAGTVNNPGDDPAQNMSQGMKAQDAWELAAQYNPATGEVGRRNPRYDNALTGTNGNRILGRYVKGPFGVPTYIPPERARVHLPVLGIPLWRIGSKGPYAGVPGGVGERITNTVLGVPGRQDEGKSKKFHSPVMPEFTTSVPRKAAEIARDTSRSPVVRTVGAVALGLASVVTVPIGVAMAPARMFARRVRDPY